MKIQSPDGFVGKVEGIRSILLIKMASLAAACLSLFQFLLQGGRQTRQIIKELGDSRSGLPTLQPEGA